MSITYRTKRGNDIILDVLKINIESKSYYVLFNMVYDKDNEGNSRISVLTDFHSTGELIYANPSFYYLPKIFQELTNIYKKKTGYIFKPGWKKLYHETCGHINLYIENLLSRSAVTLGISFFRGMSREEMLQSAEIADVGFEDGNSAWFNDSSVKKGSERTDFWLKLSKANLRKSLHFKKADYEFTFTEKHKTF